MRPLEAVSPRPLRLSAPAPLEPELIYAWEPFDRLVKELPPLFHRHWQEIALRKESVPLDPNWELFYFYASAGLLHVLTVRADGILVGYLFVLAGPHLHYASTKWAHVDMFWLDPLFRRGWAGVKMLIENEKHMRSIGAKVVVIPTKLHFLAERGGLGKLLKRLGYEPIEMVYSKTLE